MYFCGLGGSSNQFEFEIDCDFFRCTEARVKYLKTVSGILYMGH